MDMKPIIVMAGTPVDTQMGMDCLSTQGLPGVFCPISEDPHQQTAFQISSTEEKIDTVVSLLCAAQREHDAFADCLRGQGVEVVYLTDLVEQIESQK